MIRIALLSLAIVACTAQQQKQAGDVEHVVIDCARAELQQQITDLVPVLRAIVSGEAVDWRAMIDGLADRLGRDAVACALNHLAPTVAETRATERQLRAPASEADERNRARTYLAERHWSFK